MNAEIMVQLHPQSQNVSEGKMVTYTCVFPGAQNYKPNMAISVGPPPVCSLLNNNDTNCTLSFTAGDEATVSCWATRDNELISQTETAIIRVQGRLAAVSDLDIMGPTNCSVLVISWTAPYTLPGVPIRNYTINITRHSDGAVLKTDTTNTTEYWYMYIQEDVVFMVAAVNDAGTGNASNFTITRPTSPGEYKPDLMIV